MSGPHQVTSPALFKQQLIQSGQVPSDMYLSKGEVYVEQVWAKAQPSPAPSGSMLASAASSKPVQTSETPKAQVPTQNSVEVEQSVMAAIQPKDPEPSGPNLIEALNAFEAEVQACWADVKNVQVRMDIEMDLKPDGWLAKHPTAINANSSNAAAASALTLALKKCQPFEVASRFPAASLVWRNGIMTYNPPSRSSAVVAASDPANEEEPSDLATTLAELDRAVAAARKEVEERNLLASRDAQPIKARSPVATAPVSSRATRSNWVVKQKVDHFTGESTGSAALGSDEDGGALALSCNGKELHGIVTVDDRLKAFGERMDTGKVLIKIGERQPIEEFALVLGRDGQTVVLQLDAEKWADKLEDGAIRVRVMKNDYKYDLGMVAIGTSESLKPILACK